jgi:colanic acid biosynthesis glycosyl transferase WcaI
MRILLLNQAFHPDVVSTAQHASDLAAALTAGGHDVTVIASRRAYDNPDKRFPSESFWQGARVIRVGNTGFGKKKAWHRASDFATFILNCAFCLLTLQRCDVVIAMTSPPLISFLASLFVRSKGGKLVCWIMDLNPDEAIAAGWLDGASTMAAVLEKILKFSLNTAESIVVLDTFMRDRILAKGIPESKISILPPWTHDSIVRYDKTARAEFRRRHGLENKFVVMYSGNHSPCHPLDTLLESARGLSSNQEIAFCFIGGGSEFQKVKSFAAAHSLANVLCLPYQPLDCVAGSLSSADLHVVAMGDPFVGIVHPCKIYNILALGIPFLYIGPERSHITELIAHKGVDGYAHSAVHGDAKSVTTAITCARRLRPAPSAAGARLAAHFSQATLLPRFTEVIEAVGPIGQRRVTGFGPRGASVAHSGAPLATASVEPMRQLNIPSGSSCKARPDWEK